MAALQTTNRAAFAWLTAVPGLARRAVRVAKFLCSAIGLVVPDRKQDASALHRVDRQLRCCAAGPGWNSVTTTVSPPDRLCRWTCCRIRKRLTPHVIHDSGGVATWQQINDALAVARGLSPETVNGTLKSSSVFETSERALFGPIGQRVNEAASGVARRKEGLRRPRDRQWTGHC